MRAIFLLTIFYFLTMNLICQNLGVRIEQSIQTTVLIKVGDYYGSGILVADHNSIFSLITAKHLIYNIDFNFELLCSNKLEIFYFENDFKKDSSKSIIVDLNRLDKDNRIRSDTIHDICVVPLGKFSKSNIIFYKGVSSETYTGLYALSLGSADIATKSELFVGDEIYFIGYPRSIGNEQEPQFDYQKPLLKRGTIAGLSNSFDTYVIDCSVYRGNSGGPVFLQRRDNLDYNIKLIGIITEFIPFYSQTIKNDVVEQNSTYGVIIPIEYALKLLYK
jgi:hypothetical protein